MTEVSQRCKANLHWHCQETRDTCACETCHRGPCASCGEDNLQRIYDGLCASCSRARSRTRPRAVQACDECGGTPAFRNPVHRRNEYLCALCHAKSGEPVVLSRSAAQHVLAGDCRTKDVADPAHEWGHVRGTKFACSRCFVTKMDPEARKAMRT